MTDAIIERCAGDMDRARCDGLKPAYWVMNDDYASDIAPSGEFLGLRVVVDDEHNAPPLLHATGTLDTAQSLLEEAATLMKQCTDTEEFDGASTITVYANMISWLRRYNKQKEKQGE